MTGLLEPAEVPAGLPCWFGAASLLSSCQRKACVTSQNKNYEMNNEAALMQAYDAWLQVRREVWWLRSMFNNYTLEKACK